MAERELTDKEKETLKIRKKACDMAKGEFVEVTGKQGGKFWKCLHFFEGVATERSGEVGKVRTIKIYPLVTRENMHEDNYFSDITIYGPEKSLIEGRPVTPPKVNWGAYGSVSPETAKAYSRGLAVAARIAKEFPRGRGRAKDWEQVRKELGME